MSGLCACGSRVTTLTAQEPARGAVSRTAWGDPDPPDGRFPPLTPDGQRRAQELTTRRAAPKTLSDRNLYPRCISRGVVGSALPMISDSANDITQAPGYVVIRHEMIHEARVIPLDGRARRSRYPFLHG